MKLDSIKFTLLDLLINQIILWENYLTTHLCLLRFLLFPNILRNYKNPSNPQFLSLFLIYHCKLTTQDLVSFFTLKIILWYHQLSYHSIYEFQFFFSFKIYDCKLLKRWFFFLFYFIHFFLFTSLGIEFYIIFFSFFIYKFNRKMMCLQFQNWLWIKGPKKAKMLKYWWLH